MCNETLSDVVGLENIQERQIAFLVSRLENMIKIPDRLMIVQNQAEVEWKCSWVAGGFLTWTCDNRR